MSIKVKLVALISLFCLVLGFIILGVRAASTQNIRMEGSITFEVANKDLYVKDVKLKQDVKDDPISLNEFMPGYINDSLNLNLGEMVNNYGSFSLYIEIINTTNIDYYIEKVELSEKLIQEGVSAKYSGRIYPGSITTPGQINSETPIDGTLSITISAPNSTMIDLSGITVFIGELPYYDINIGTLENGSVTMDKNYSAEGDKVLINTNPNENYYALYVYYKLDGESIPHYLNQESENVYSFIMPSENVTIIALFETIILDGYEFDGSTFVRYNGSNNILDIPSIYSTKEINGEEKLVRGSEGSNPTTVTKITEGYASLAPRNVNIVSMIIPETITEIGRGAFSDYYSLVEIYNKTNIDILGNAESFGLRIVNLGDFYLPAFHKTLQLIYNYEQSNLIFDTEFIYQKYKDSYYLVKYTGENYQLDEEYYPIWDNVGSMGVKNITLPTSLPLGINSNNYNIGTAAFAGNCKLKSITIPSNVNEIGVGAFAFCRGLEEVNIESETEEIDEYLFAYCDNLKEIMIPANIKTIKDMSFPYCPSLETVSFETNSLLESIGYAAFSYCYNLSNIELPNTLESIGGSAFYDCKNLKNITIPSSVNSFGDYTFGGCENLQNITFNGKSSLKEIPRGAFIECSSLKSFNIPSSVETIKEGAFASCTGLSSVTFEEGSLLQSIGDNAFSNCVSLTKITIPLKVTTIGSDAFAASNLSSVTFEEGSLLQSIGDYAFNSLSNFAEITIPSNVTTIGIAAFYTDTLIIESENVYSSSYDMVFSLANQSFKILKSIVGDDVINDSHPCFNSNSFTIQEEGNYYVYTRK